MEKQNLFIADKNGTKGITLIALVITIIVLLILAAVSIATLTGENGILTKASTANEETSHAQVSEEIKLEMANHTTESKLGETDLTIIEYLGKEGYLEGYNAEGDLENSYVISKEKFDNIALGKGTSKTTGDVYIIEKVDDESSSTSEKWVLKYYETTDKSKDLLNITVNKNEETSSTVKFTINGVSFECEKGTTFRQFLLENDIDLDEIFKSNEFWKDETYGFEFTLEELRYIIKGPGDPVCSWQEGLTVPAFDAGAGYCYFSVSTMDEIITEGTKYYISYSIV